MRPVGRRWPAGRGVCGNVGGTGVDDATAPPTPVARPAGGGGVRGPLHAEDAPRLAPHACGEHDGPRSRARGPDRASARPGPVGSLTGPRATGEATPEYPLRLVDDRAAPEVLFVRGSIGQLDGPCVAVVGTRSATHYGTSVAAELGAALSDAGVVVISGLAAGIDAAAHEGALGSENPPAPVAVVGGGSTSSIRRAAGGSGPGWNELEASSPKPRPAPRQSRGASRSGTGSWPPSPMSSSLSSPIAEEARCTPWPQRTNAG